AVHKPFQIVDMKHPQSLLQLPVHSPLNLLSLPSPLNPHQVHQFSSNQLLIFFYLTTTSTICNRFQQSANITKNIVIIIISEQKFECNGSRKTFHENNVTSILFHSSPLSFNGIRLQPSY